MTELATVRFFCLAVPSAGPSLGYDYLTALDKHHKVLACAIGHGFLMSSPWSSVYQLFSGQTAKRYANVVCAPPNFLMGTRIIKGRDGLSPDSPGAEGEIAYEPATALSGLFTVGVPNIAITMPRPKPPEPSEIRALARYDAVISPTEADAEALRALGVPASCVPPEPDRLEAIVRGLL